MERTWSDLTIQSQDQGTVTTPREFQPDRAYNGPPALENEELAWSHRPVLRGNESMVPIGAGRSIQFGRLLADIDSFGGHESLSAALL